MKDIIITGRRIRTELFILVGCFGLAFCTNIFAIIKYSRPAVELVSMIGFVIVLTVIYYLLLWVLRLIVMAVAWIVRKAIKK